MSKQKPTVEIREPFAGWSHITITDENGKTFDGRFSYLQDIYQMFLHAFLVYLQEAQQVAISIDEEGCGFTIVITPYSLDIIEDRSDTPMITRLYIEDTEFMQQCMTAFEEHFDKWIRFTYYGPEDEEHYDTDVQIARDMTANIHKYIDQKDHIWQNIAKSMNEKEPENHE